MTWNGILICMVTFISLSCALSGSNKKNNFRRVDNSLCDQATMNGDNVGTVLNLSRLACARLCSETELCHFFKSSSEIIGNSHLCEVFSLNAGNGSKPTRHSQSLDSFPDHVTFGCYRADDWFPSSYYDNSQDLEPNIWVANRDTDDPATETWRKDEFGKSDKEAKFVFRDGSSGITYSVAISFLRPTSTMASGSSPYTIERDPYGYFKESEASRVIFSFYNTGLVYTSFVHPNGTFWMTTKSPSRLQVFVRRPNEYSTLLQYSDSVAANIIDNFEKGYKAEEVKYALTSGTGSQTVVMYSFEEQVMMVGGSGKTLMPVMYYTFLEKYPEGRQKYKQQFGLVSELDNFSEAKRQQVSFSPLWKPMGEKSWNSSRKINSLAISMSQGHAFRVAFDGGFYDVEAVIKMNDGVYFILPQLGHNPENQLLHQAVVAQRAVVSLEGFYSFCSYRLESEDVLDSGFKDVSDVQPFVDRKIRVPVLSVLSNGTIIFGSVARVAEGTMAGQDVTILIEWQTIDMAMLLGVVMVTVKDDGTPDVVVTAESRVTWDVDVNAQGKLAVSDSCDMRKLLARSNGHVDILYHNVHSRKPVVRVPYVKTTWFLS